MRKTISNISTDTPLRSELAQKPRNELTSVPELTLSQIQTKMQEQQLTRADLSEYELATVERYEFENGPFAVLSTAVRERRQVLISLRNNHKLLARIRAFDRHCNMVLQNVKEMWSETPRLKNGKKGKSLNRDRFVSTLSVPQMRLMMTHF